MPNIDLIPEVLYRAMDPYHYRVDNLPLKNILTRQQLMNFVINSNEHEIQLSSGNTGGLHLRLNRSLNENGTLKANEIDDSLHSIGAHQDGIFDDGTGEQFYVRMTKSERDKLSLVSEQANKVTIKIQEPSNNIETYGSEIILKSTDTVSVTRNNQNIEIRTNFSKSLIKRNFYEVKPLQSTSGDYQNWMISNPSTPFVEGSLKVYIEGIRVPRKLTLTQGDSVYEERGVYVPPPGSDKSLNWIFLSFTADPQNGTFSFNQPINENHNILIDFDTSIT